MQKSNFNYKIKNEQVYVCIDIKSNNLDIYEKLESCPFQFPEITKVNDLEYILQVLFCLFFLFPHLTIEHGHSSMLVHIDLLKLYH